MTVLQVQVVAWTFLIIGLMFLLLGCLGVKDELRLKRRCVVKTTAILLRYEHWGKSITPYTIWVPVYEIAKATGETIQWESKAGRERKRFSPGDTVTLYYDPYSPDHDYYIPTERPFSLPLVFVFVGLITACICTYLLVKPNVFIALIGTT